MTLRKSPNQREIIKNMILLRKYNTKIASLKYLKKPTNKGRVNANTNICQSPPQRMEKSFAYKTI